MGSSPSRCAVLAAAATLSLGLTVATVPSASAAGVCATKSEYHKVDKGMTFRKVKQIFGGAPTTQTSNGAGYIAAGWKECGTKEQSGILESGACIGFQNHKVKARTWSDTEFFCAPPGGPSRVPATP